MAEQAKKQAIEDIKEELAIHGKCFLAFLGKLDPIMETLVNEQIKKQEQLNSVKK